MKTVLIILATVALAYAMPEPPRGRPQKQIYAEQTEEYVPPGPYPSAIDYSPPEQEYGPPAQEYAAPAQEYGPPAQTYGPPAAKIITKNVYVHIPPEEPAEIIKYAPLEAPIAKKHYKIIFIKAPAPVTPQPPIIPLTPQDEHKTLVYVLVKKPEEPKPIELPQAEPTEPSKPEVYFIKYKHSEKEPAPVYGPPSTTYGAPAY